MEFIEGVPPDLVMYTNHIVYRLINEDKVQYMLLRPGVRMAGTNFKWKQTHYMVIEEPSAKPLLPMFGGFEESLQKNSQSEDKPFKKAWDEAGEEAQRVTLSPHDRIDIVVETMDSQLKHMEESWSRELAEYRQVFSGRLDTHAQSLEKLMDIVNVLIKKVVDLEGKR